MIMRYNTKEAAIEIYDQCLLPYASILLLPCSIVDQCELQICQNNALRICTYIYLGDRIRIIDVHAKCNLISLEQRLLFEIFGA